MTKIGKIESIIAKILILATIATAPNIVTLKLSHKTAEYIINKRQSVIQQVYARMINPIVVYAEPGFNPAELPFEPKGIVTQAALGDSVFAYTKKDNKLVGKTTTSYDDILKTNGFYDIVIPTDLASTPQIEGPAAGDELYFKIKQGDDLFYQLTSIGGPIIHHPGQIERWDFDVGTDVNEYIDWFKVKEKYK